MKNNPFHILYCKHCELGYIIREKEIIPLYVIKPVEEGESGFWTGDLICQGCLNLLPDFDLGPLLPLLFLLDLFPKSSKK